MSVVLAAVVGGFLVVAVVFVVLMALITDGVV